MKTSIFKTALRLAIFTAILFSLDTTLKAENPDYSPLLTDGKVWIFEQPVIVYDWPTSGEKGTYLLKTSLTVGEDIEHDGKKGKRILVHCLNDDVPEKIKDMGWTEDHTHDLYEIDRVVYWHSHYGEMVPIIPFNLEVGDSIFKHYPSGEKFDLWFYPVSAKNTFSLNGQTYKRWIIQSRVPLTRAERDTGLHDIIIEGIGNTFGAFGYLNLSEADNGVIFFEPRLFEVYENGELIFTYDDFFTGLENAGMSEMDIPDEEDNSIYDLLGRKLSQKPEKGIYICNGKKYIAR